MTTYSFKVTKGRYQLMLSTTDRDMIVEEFEKWVKSISDYVHKNKGHDDSSRAKVQAVTERELTQRKIDEELKRIPRPERVEEAPVVEKNETEKDLDVIFNQAKEKEEENVRPTIETENENVQNVFDTILDRSMQTPQTELSFKPNPSIKKDNAFFFFFLKLMQNVAIILDHSVVQEAINREYLECLPDLTGVVGASEYRLTAYGEKILLEEG